MKIILNNPIVVGVVGPPFGGKNTLIKKLANSIYNDGSGLEVRLHDNGTALRKAVENPDYTDYMKNILSDSMNTVGETVPGVITISLLKEFFFKNYNGKRCLILGGILRTLSEPGLFIKLTDKYLPGIQRYFIRLNISEDESWERYKERKREKRDDDTKLEERLMTYKETNIIYQNIIDVGYSLGFIPIDVDGEQSPNEILDIVVNKINRESVTENPVP